MNSAIPLNFSNFPLLPGLIQTVCRKICKNNSAVHSFLEKKCPLHFIRLVIKLVKSMIPNDRDRLIARLFFTDDERA